MGRSVDIFVSYKFVKILTTPWEEMEAFHLGIIDENGKVLRKSRTLKTAQEKKAYTIFHRLIFGIKRIIEKTPFGKSKLATYTGGLLLLKESPKNFSKFISEEPFYISPSEIEELDRLYEEILEESSKLQKGEYKLVNDVFAGEKEIGKVGDIVINKKDQESELEVAGDKSFLVIHKKTGKEILVSLEDLTLPPDEKDED